MENCIVSASYVCGLECISSYIVPASKLCFVNMSSHFPCNLQAIISTLQLDIESS